MNIKNNDHYILKCGCKVKIIHAGFMSVLFYCNHPNCNSKMLNNEVYIVVSEIQSLDYEYIVNEQFNKDLKELLK